MRVAIGLGANLKNPVEMIRRAVELLTARGLGGVQLASMITTKPVDCVPGTPDFTNTAVVGNWSGTPQELLAVTQSIEHDLGRPDRHSSHEARVIDLDILLFGSETVNTNNLIIPHPRLHQRYFALKPLSELAPDWIVPEAGKTVKELLEALK